MLFKTLQSSLLGLKSRDKISLTCSRVGLPDSLQNERRPWPPDGKAIACDDDGELAQLLALENNNVFM